MCVLLQSTMSKATLVHAQKSMLQIKRYILNHLVMSYLIIEAIKGKNTHTILNIPLIFSVYFSELREKSIATSKSKPTSNIDNDKKISESTPNPPTDTSKNES